MLIASGIPVLVVRGGAAKCAYFLAADLPSDPRERAETVTALLGPSCPAVVVDHAEDPAADVDCLVVQGAPGPVELLAGVGAFAVERRLVPARTSVVPVRARMPDGVVATVRVPARGGRPEYTGDTAISGVAGTGARVLIEFAHGADSVLLPTGRAVDDLCGVPATLIGNGAPVVVVAAAALGVSGYETPARLEYDHRLRARVEGLRMKAGAILGLGDVSDRSAPQMCLVATPAAGGGLCVRVFGPGRVHPSIDAFSAMSLAAAAGLLGGVAVRSRRPAAPGVPRDVLRLEHPSGFLDVQAEVTGKAGAVRMSRSAVVTTARLLLEGHAFI